MGYCDRNICYRNEYAGIDCKDCEVMRMNETNEIVSADLKKGMQFDLRELHWFELNCAVCYNGSCKYLDKPKTLKRSELDHRCKDFASAAHSYEKLEEKYLIRCLDHEFSYTNVTKDWESTKSMSDAMIFKNEQDAIDHAQTMMNMCTNRAIQSLSSYVPLKHCEIQKFVAEQSWKVYKEWCERFSRTIVFRYPNCPLDYDIIFHSIVGKIMFYMYEYICEHHTTKIDEGNFPIKLEIAKLTKFCNKAKATVTSTIG